ncbi:hypothetical protein LMH73_028420 [Vibrio splendidus]
MKKSISALAVVAMLSTATFGTFVSTDAEARARSGGFSSRSFSAPSRPAPSRPAPSKPAKPQPKPAQPAKPQPKPATAQQTKNNSEVTRLGQSRTAKPIVVQPKAPVNFKPVAPVNMNKPTAPTAVNMNKPTAPTAVSMSKPAVAGAVVGGTAIVATSTQAKPSVGTPVVNGMNRPALATPAANGMNRPAVATPVANGMNRPAVATPVANGMNRPAVATPVVNGMNRPAVAQPVRNGMVQQPIMHNSQSRNNYGSTASNSNMNYSNHNSGMSSGTGMLLGLGGGLLLGDMLNNSAMANDAVQNAEVAMLKTQLAALEAEKTAQEISASSGAVFNAAMPTGAKLSSEAQLESMLIKHKTALFMAQGVQWHQISNPSSYDQIAYIQYKTMMAAQQASLEIFGTPATMAESVKSVGMIGIAAKGIYENVSTSLQVK